MNYRNKNFNNQMGVTIPGFPNIDINKWIMIPAVTVGGLLVLKSIGVLKGRKGTKKRRKR